MEEILNKRKSTQKKQISSIKNIISNVKKNGDKAVLKYEKKFIIFGGKEGVLSYFINTE